ncbi:DEAD/DEAH box helicase [Oscillatoria sp. FACHB-1407]|uniref:DEAD/DEAH box helicase n=1 Tax=Oscillatoria sp. FACHB-1407 TaxID=2692847 RepID=UPI001681D5C4|nr:DEAD/DEAH box helicase [Oscillatoria sp. FACHB-1407]MBD2461642.1 DEAD/DEAH box helicase [Oscillatoria sp. FACHB-1407]
MAILHGSWLIQPQHQPSTPVAPAESESVLGNRFLIWGETWRRIDPTEFAQSDQPQPHPFGMNGAELTALLRSLHQSQQLQWAIADVSLEPPEPDSKAGAKRGKRKATATVETATIPVVTDTGRWQTVAIALPTYQVATETEATVAIPQHSGAATSSASDDADTPTTSPTLQSWLVTGIVLTPLEAIQFLNSLPLSSMGEEESFLGGDLRFWSHVARWSLDLLARSKFLPQLEPQSEGSAIAYWQPLLDSGADQGRLEQFTHQMPVVCRTYLNTQQTSATPEPTAFPLASTLLFDFLKATMDAQLRVVMQSGLAASPASNPQALKEAILRDWLKALGDTAQLTTEPAKLERLQTAIAQWTAPIQHQLSQSLASFRTCFYLQTPSYGQADWVLEYFLQSASDPGFLVSAKTIWQNPVERLVYLGRTIDRPQETLLAGLGLASRLYPVLEPSLQVSKPQSCRLNPMQVYDFLKTVSWRLQDSGFGVVLPGSLSNQQGWASRLGLSVRAAAPLKSNQRLGLQSLLNFKWELTIGGQRLSKEEFDRLVALKTPLVEVNGEWVELRPQDVRAAQSFFASRKDQMALSLEDALRISTGDTQTIEKLPVVNFEASGALSELINTLTTGNQNVEPIPIPEGFQGELRPYQVRGASWLAFLEKWGLGACLADDMGLGKTVQLIALLLHLKEQGTLENPTLLVCPTSVLGNWEREVKRFAPNLKLLVHHGDKRAQGRDFARAIQGKHLVITSYPLVYRDVKDLQTVPWQGVVLDEAQNIKNSEAKQSQAVRQLNAQFRIALTGTPVENRLAELWSILDFLNPGYLGPKNFFQRRFAVPIERYGDTASLQTLRSLVQPFILRRLKTDRSIIQDLPEKQEMTVFCGLSAEQAAIYQRLVDKSLEDIESAEGIQRHGKILALLVRLKQICNHPELLKSDEDSEKTEERKAKNEDNSDLNLQSSLFLSRSGKLQRLTEMLDELLSEGDRALIFTQFAEWGKLLQTYLSKQFNREILFLYGSTSKKQREEMVDRFQNDPQAPRIFILSLKAGGVGLNLTRANHVFHFDRWWNPAVENQATDRVFRIGQTRNVQVHKFVCTGTLEERIHDLIESKKALSEQIVGTGENWLTELDTEQLRNLLLLDRTAVIDDSSS